MFSQSKKKIMNKEILYRYGPAVQKLCLSLGRKELS